MKSHPQSKTLTSLALLAALAASLFIVLLTATSAQASGLGGDSGTSTGGTGGDGCVILGWANGRSLNDIPIVMGADGAACGNPITVEKGVKTIAPKCWDNRNDIAAVFWTYDIDDSWATSNSNGPDVALQTRDATRSMLRGQPNSVWLRPNGQPHRVGEVEYPAAMLRETAINAVDGANFNVLVCVWVNESTPYICSYLPEWDLWANAYPGRTIMKNYATAMRRCFQRCPDDSAQNAGQRIPIEFSSPRDMARYCGGGTGNPDPGGNGWWEYAWGSELGYGIPTTQTAGGLHPYTYYTTLQDGGKPVRGQKPFETSMEWDYTAFGEFYNEWCSLEEGCVASDEFKGTDSQYIEEFKAAYEAALAELAVEPHVAVDMDSNQRAAFAQGRIVNVVESQSYAYAYVTEKVDYYYKRYCEINEYYNEVYEDGVLVGWDGPYQSGPNCTSWERAPEQQQDLRYVDYEYLQSFATPETTQAFQLLSNHCNSEGFATVNDRQANSVTKNGPGTIPSGDPENYYSASMVSPVYSSISDLPWGGTNEASKTNRAKFFDKVCSYEGRLANPDTNQPINDPDRAKWVYFRDGEWNRLNLNYFIPVSQGGVEYNGEDPVATHLARDPDGTPDTDLMNFRALDGDTVTDKVFKTNGSEAPVQRQWMTDGEEQYFGPHSTIIPGGYTKWEAWGTWATTSRLPQVLQARWKFEPEVVMTSAVDNVGFGEPAGRMSWSTDSIRSRVAGMVESVHSSTTSPSTPTLKSHLMTHTGSETPPRMDSPLFWGSDKDSEGRWLTDPTSYDPHYYSVQWVRAVSE